MKMNQRGADLLLALVSMVWGCSYLLMDAAMAEVPPFELIFLRFGIAFLALAAVFPRRLRQMDRRVLLQACATGGLMVALFGFLMYGLHTTPPSQAAFLISLTVVFVPCIDHVWKRQKMPAAMVLCLVACVAGIALMTLDDHLALSAGSVMCILGALAYGFQIVLTDRFVAGTDAILLGMVEMGTASVMGLVLTFAFENPVMPTAAPTWLSILGLAILCSSFGFVAQPAAQVHTSPEHTAFLFSLEPVFAALFAFLFVGDVLSGRELLGAVLILASVMFVSMRGSKE